MKKKAFLAEPAVNSFMDWLEQNAATLPVCLRIGESRFVPNGVHANLSGIEDVLRHYCWRSTGMSTGDWGETVLHLRRLSAALSVSLQQARKAPNDAATLAACKAILVWGGNRNFAVGAYPILHNLATAGALCNYLEATRSSFALANADTAALCPPVAHMNSMLTKVHALASADGLPIYDSRVAAAIASLVELWRYQSGGQATPLPPALAFPATMIARTVHRLFPSAANPDVLVYGEASTVGMWSSAKVRLGWLMEKVLTDLPNLFASVVKALEMDEKHGQPSSFHASVAPNVDPRRMHAFEAALFMIGYDVRCLGCGIGMPVGGPNRGSSRERFKALQQEVPSQVRIGSRTKRTLPLSGKGQPIEYSGQLTTGFDIDWGAAKFLLEPEYIKDLLAHFGGQTNVPLGASMTDTASARSLGRWLADIGGGFPRRYASAIAAVLAHEGLLTTTRSGRALLLHFP